MTSTTETRPLARIARLIRWSACIAVASLVVLAAQPAQAQCTIERGFSGPANVGTNSLDGCDDCTSGAVALPMADWPNGLNYFGSTYNQIFINSNGNITFDSSFTGFTPFPFPQSRKMIAPYFADMDLRDSLPGGGNAIYWHFDNSGPRARMLISYITTEYWSRSSVPGTNTLQMVITNRDDRAPGDFDVEFRFEDINWTTGSASGGSGGLGGTPAQVGFDAGNGMDFFSHPLSFSAGVVNIDTTPSNWPSPTCATGSFLFNVVNACGDTVISPGETCDDGNSMAGDGCDVFCGEEPGWSCIGMPSMCTMNCGNGAFEPMFGEECDDGNILDGDGCDSSCNIDITCGNGTLDPGEQCDNGAGGPGDGCDDIFCTVEPGWDCAPTGLMCTALPPNTADDTATIAEDNTLSVPAPGVLGNDSNVFSVAVDTNVSNGTLTLNANGSYTYTPSSNFAGSDFFVYVATGPGGTDTARVDITVTPTPDPPVAGDDAYTTDEDTPLSVPAPGVLANDADVDGDLVGVVVASTTQPPNGSVTMQADGSFIYTPNLNFNGTDTFQYQVTDSLGVTDTATVTLTVNPIQDAPIGGPDFYTVTEEEVLTVPAPGVAANDVDPDGDMLSTTVVVSTTNGTVSMSADGSFVYTPDPNFDGVDTFTYEVDDGNGGEALVLVTITVTNVNDRPVGGQRELHERRGHGVDRRRRQRRSGERL